MSSHISWKDKTFIQVITSINKNKNGTIINRRNMHNPPPLKIYRKEIPVLTVQSKSSRLSVSISSLETPNGYTNSSSIPTNAFTTTLDAKVINGPTDCVCVDNVTFTPQQNAKRRIRTSGIIKPSYNLDTKQYLQRRNISFDQNTYHYLRNGDSTSKPGTSGSTSNVYAMQANISTDCSANVGVVYKPTNAKFAQNGAVSSSSLITRKKYIAITDNAHKYLKPFGAAVADAMAYGISDSVYTYKSKIAFPNKITPVSKKNTTTLHFCENFTSRR